MDTFRIAAFTGETCFSIIALLAAEGPRAPSGKQTHAL
jgi:hypothetical protein